MFHITDMNMTVAPTEPCRAQVRFVANLRELHEGLAYCPLQRPERDILRLKPPSCTATTRPSARAWVFSGKCRNAR